MSDARTRALERDIYETVHNPTPPAFRLYAVLNQQSAVYPGHFSLVGALRMIAALPALKPRIAWEGERR